MYLANIILCVMIDSPMDPERVPQNDDEAFLCSRQFVTPRTAKNKGQCFDWCDSDDQAKQHRQCLT